jgi:hypothetical protein
MSGLFKGWWLNPGKTAANPVKDIDKKYLIISLHFMKK